MNDSEYVRKDVFDETIKRLDISSDAVYKALTAKVDSLEKRLDDMKDAISRLHDTVSRGWAIVGVIAALAAFALTAVQFYLAVRR